MRVAYLGLLLVGTLPACWPLHVIQFIGVNASVVVDYCLLARLLALAPWNRSQPLTTTLLRQVVFSPPVRGSSAMRSTARPCLGGDRSRPIRVRQTPKLIHC